MIVDRLLFLEMARDRFLVLSFRPSIAHTVFETPDALRQKPTPHAFPRVSLDQLQPVQEFQKLSLGKQYFVIHPRIKEFAEKAIIKQIETMVNM